MAAGGSSKSNRTARTRERAAQPAPAPRQQRATRRATRDAAREPPASPFVGLVTVPADKYRGGYSSLQLRADLAASYRDAYRHVHALGGVLTSSGGIRDLHEKATAGRSKTSLHYTGRALDLFIYSGMQGGDEPMLVTRAGGTDANPEWKLYCVSTTPMPANPLYDAAWIAERDVECVRWVKNVGYRTFTRRATCFCLTDVMARYGWEPIPARGTWRTEYTACEWWHFQNAQGLTLGVSTFGEQLIQVWPKEAVRASGLSLGAVWAGRSFRLGGVPPADTHPAPALANPAEKILWAQTMLNAVAGTALSADGKFGDRTGAALRQFQADTGIATTGLLDATTEVALLQRALERLDGAVVPRIGVLDDATVGAITAFQRAHALKADGRAGSKTRAAMMAAIAAHRQPRATRGHDSEAGAVLMTSSTATARAVRTPVTEHKAGATPSRALEHAMLRISVINGDLTFARQPLLLGHYRSSRLTGTERVMNRYIGNAMEAALRAGGYPDLAGTNQIFLNTAVNPHNPWQMPRPEAVIVVGLGEEGKLDAADLVATVRQAVIAWTQRVAEMGDKAPSHFQLAATLIGSGGTGISTGQSAQLIAQGVCEARERIANLHVQQRRWPRVSHLHLIELYLDRATEAWRALQLQAQAAPGQFEVSATIQPGAGALRRSLDSGYRGADYDFITAATQGGPNGDTSIAYTLDTKRARTEVRAQALQERLLRDVVAKASNDTNGDTRIGYSLFNLLVPLEMQPFLGGTTEMLLELDRGTAGIPWELLDTNARRNDDSRPWAIRAKLLRKLRIDDFVAQVSDATAEANVLVIGEPACDPPYDRLPGARTEAMAVAKRFAKPGVLGAGKVTALVSASDDDKPGPDALTVINTLLERDWRIVHIAGHGDNPQPIARDEAAPNGNSQPCDVSRGVVLSGGTFLGPRELRTLRPVPELVFVNCCHLAARNGEQLLSAPFDRVRFASGVAEQLIKIGVRCVIAAGWAVEDEAASAFATTFYDALLRGDRFIDSVTEARVAALDRGGNTWAAYQCYGDPDWTFRREGADAQRPAASPGERFGGIASSTALIVALETIAVQSKFQHAPAEAQRADLRHLDAQFAPHWGDIGEVAEAFGSAWSEVGDRAAAKHWYERAVAAADGSASLRATEQLANVSARLAWESVDAASQAHHTALHKHHAPNGSRTTARKTATEAKHRTIGTSKALASEIRDARMQVGVAIRLLDTLVALRPTMEREGLYGSAYMRLAMIEAAASDTETADAAVREMKTHYERAEALGREEGSNESFYPALKAIAADLVLNVARRGWTGLDPDTIGRVQAALEVKARDDPDFRSVLGQTELRLYEALARQELAAAVSSLEQAYGETYARVSSARMWASVYNTARFVLPRYASHAPAAEKRAAEKLLQRVEQFAHAGKPH